MGGDVAQGRTRPPSIPVSCQKCHIRTKTVCRPLEGDRLEIVERFKYGDCVLPAGSHLYRPGEICTELYNLLDGWVSLYRIIESGRRQILDFCLPGSFLGYQAQLLGPMLHGAECITDVAVCIFPRQPFGELIERNPSLAARLIRMIAQDLAIARDHLTNVGSRTARGKICHLLLELSLRLCPQGPEIGNREVEIPLTQNHIAEALGLTSVYVSQTLKQLREQELLLFRHGRLRILDFEGLAKVADLDDLLCT